MHSFGNKKPVEIAAELLLQGQSRQQIIHYFAENHGVKEFTTISWHRKAKKLLPALSEKLRAQAEEAERVRQVEKMNRDKVSKDVVLKKYWRMAQADVRKMYKEDGSLKKIHELDDETAAGLLMVTVYDGKDPARRGQILSFKFANPKYVLDSIAKLQGYNTPPAEEIPDDEFDIASLDVKFE